MRGSLIQGTSFLFVLGQISAFNVVKLPPFEHITEEGTLLYLRTCVRFLGRYNRREMPHSIRLRWFEFFLSQDKFFCHLAVEPVAFAKKKYQINNQNVFQFSFNLLLSFDQSPVHEQTTELQCDIEVAAPGLIRFAIGAKTQK